MTRTASVISAVSAIILAGGQSRRMGKDKTQLELGGQSLLERTIQVMSTLTDDVIVAGNRLQPLTGAPAQWVNDIIAGQGALSGLHAGLTAARYEYALVVACDMPFLNPRLLRYMVVIAPGYDAIVPHWQGEAQPLHAIYARACLPAIKTSLDYHCSRIVDFYPEVNVRYLEHSEITLFDPSGLSFFNINTPQDWEQAQTLEIERSQQQSE